MKRLATAWLVAAIVLTVLGSSRGDLRIGAQETSTPATGDIRQGRESELLLTQIADAQRNEDALHAELAAALATEQAGLVATVTALEGQVTAAEATSAALASEVAALQTEVAELEAGGVTMPAGVVEVGMNEVAQVGAWEITVTGVQRGNEIESRTAGEEPAAAVGEFLVVELEIVNMGVETQTYDPSWFEISDERGRSWPFDFTQTDNLALAEAGIRQYAAVEPGLPQTAVVVFDIAEDATGLTLRTLPADELEFTSAPQPAPFIISLAEE
jgi:hypothetical protein